MINLFDFPQGPQLARQAQPAARAIARLRQRYREAGAPVIYVNDNFMQWQADFRQIQVMSMQPERPGAAIAQLLQAGADDYSILKPKHSAFLATPLSVLLSKLGITRLALTGIATDSCIAATALDANMREYEVQIPSDCVAATTPARSRRALAMLAQTDRIDVVRSVSVSP